MNKKLVSLVLSGLIVLNSTGCLETVYADNNQQKELINNEDTKSGQVVYLANGEGPSTGSGTKEYPYQNIRTALEKIQDGGTLKLVGNVSYGEYEQDSNGAALPLEIKKNITIEGEKGSLFTVRGSIQLEADVTFKDVNIELIPEVLLGRGTAKSSNGILGTPVERSTTIYVNGHQLTLDNVNTRLGTNLDQYKERPYISGGSHKSSPAPTTKSVINIINPNDETRFSGIYAGDYNKDLSIDVEINIDGKTKVDDYKIYTGGHNHKLNGNVTINLSGNNFITKFDKANHEGNIDVNLKKDTFIYNFDATNVNNLTLEENSKIILSNNANFDVNNVVLKNDSTIDFTEMINDNPIVKGNFDGESTIDDSRKGGTILLDSKQRLDIKGRLTGTTRLSHSNVDMFEDGCVYIKTYGISDGTFILEDSIFSDYELKCVQNGNCIDWTIEMYKEDFGSFELTGDNKIEYMNNGTNSGEGKFIIEFINTNGDKYVPYYELYTDFEYTLTTLDENGNKEVIHLDTQNDMGIDFYICSDYPTVELAVVVEDMNNLKNKKITLKVTHIKTQTSISKDIYDDIKSPDTPNMPESTPEDILKPEQSIIEDISKIEGIEFEKGNATEENPISIKVATLSGLNDLFDYYKNNNFNVESGESPKEDGNFLVYLVKITKSTTARAEQFYFMEIKVAKDNKAVIEKVEQELNNNTTNNNSGNSSNETNKEEYPQINISDIKGHWAEADILNFAKQGYINGYEDRTFRPNNSITRAEFIKIANKVFGYNNKGTEKFSDVNPGAWYYDEVCIAVNAGYIDASQAKFRPNDTITRQEVAAIITSIKACKDSKLDRIKLYKDYNQISSWAQTSVEGAVERGYMGVGVKEFRPKANITRAEAVATLSRLK